MMEVEVTQENLSRALLHTSRLASSRNKLPVLNNILIRTTKTQLFIAATNLEIAATQKINAKIIKQGSTTVPAKLFSDYIQNLPKEKVTLSLTQSTLTIRCGKYSSSIHCVSDEEFPELPGITEKDATRYTVNAQDFKQDLQQTTVAASTDATRPVLTGIYWHTVDGKLYLAATDGYRLAEKEVMKAATEISAIVPVDAAQEVLRTVDESTESIEILFDDIQVRFRFDEIEITSKLIDGQFPNYRQLIPKKSDITFTINKSDLLRVTKIAALFAYGSGGAITLTTKQEQNELQVRSIASEVGENTSSIPVDGLESDGEITLNARYITDLLSTLNTERLQIGFSGGLSPCVITPVETKGYTHIIMPIKS